MNRFKSFHLHTFFFKFLQVFILQVTLCYMVEGNTGWIFAYGGNETKVRPWAILNSRASINGFDVNILIGTCKMLLTATINHYLHLATSFCVQIRWRKKKVERKIVEEVFWHRESVVPLFQLPVEILYLSKAIIFKLVDSCLAIIICLI